MRKNAKIKSKDGNGTLEITIKYNSNKYELTRDEVNRLVERTTNEVFGVLGKVPFSSFGVHNTEVSI